MTIAKNNAKGKKVQIVFIVDTTASMGWLREVLKKTMLVRATRLFSAFADVEIAFIFIGDDVNPRERYSVTTLTFTRDTKEIASWMDKVGNSYGGGPHANYALGLRAARQLPWKADAVKLIEVVGDEVPQRDGFIFLDGTTCDWRFEAKQLVNMGGSIDAVHCFPGWQSHNKWFYEGLADLGNGHYFAQDQLSDLEYLSVGRIYAALTADVNDSDSPFARFEAELYAQNRVTNPVATALATMTGRKPKQSTRRALAKDLVPVPSGQLQLLTVNVKANVKSNVTTFLNDNGFVLKGGDKVKRLYQYTGLRDGKTRNEDVQWYKDIVLRDKATGEFFSGDGVRKILGIPLVAEKQDFQLKPGAIPDGFDVFIESTSHSRLLAEGDEILVDQTQPPSSAKNPCR